MSKELEEAWITIYHYNDEIIHDIGSEYIENPLKEELDIIEKALQEKAQVEQEIDFPLVIAFKALKEGIYIEEGQFPYTSFEKYNVRGIELNGLGVISNVCSFGDCDFTCYYKDYKKTWWLKPDRSE